jgi:hypothetical protein
VGAVVAVERRREALKVDRHGGAKRAEARLAQRSLVAVPRQRLIAGEQAPQVGVEALLGVALAFLDPAVPECAPIARNKILQKVNERNQGRHMSRTLES